MMQERPSILEAKQKYLFKEDNESNVKKIRNLYFELEEMRMQSEHDRIKTYKEMLENLLN
jgi:hypothetical protein